MEILVAVPLSKFPICSQISCRRWNHARMQVLHCFKNAGESGLPKYPDPVELQILNDDKVHQNELYPINNGKEEKGRDIWKLFKEAQQNILYLNKQRLLAMEEVDRVKSERDSLLDRVKQLDMRKQENPARDKSIISAELLLRIDSLVLNGMISSMEGSDLRSLVINSRGSLVENLYDIISANDSEFLAELRHFSKRSRVAGFHIIHICTEMSPVVSVSSLASYVTGISRALQRKGNHVEVILPKYACLNLEDVQGLREVETEFYSYFNGQLHGNRVWTGVVCGIGVTFIQPVYYSSLFSSDKVYGCSNDFERFTYFSRASLDYLVKSGKKPDVLHIHNWQTSIVGPLFWDVFVNQGLEGTKILLTCQGFDSQCLDQPEKLALCGLDPQRLFRPDRLQDNMKSHLVNLLKGGIVYSNKVIILSPVQTKGRIIRASGPALEPTLTVHKEKVEAAPVGFDRFIWDPSRDNLLPHNYSAEDLTGKSKCKVTLQRRMGLPESTSSILVGCIYYQVSDADLEKLKALIGVASRRGLQFIFMVSGQTPIQFIREQLRGDNVRFIDEYHEELSHLIIAGSDIMLCSSLDDPMHQVPLKAIAYGSAPIPLHFYDTIESDTKFSEFVKYRFGNMDLERAMDEIESDEPQWKRRMVEGMEQDFSWDSECGEVHLHAYAAVKEL